MNRKLTPIASAVTLLMLGASMASNAQQAAPATAEDTKGQAGTGDLSWRALRTKVKQMFFFYSMIPAMPSSSKRDAEKAE